MAKSDTRARRAGEPVDFGQLKSDWLHCVEDRGNSYWERQRLNWETRYAVWAGQTTDGRKWPRNNKTKCFPWRGAADSKVLLVDKYVQEDVAMLMQAWTTMRILVRPNSPAKDAAWAKRVTSMLRWLVYEEMDETERESEYLANLMVERGAAAMGVWWDRAEAKALETIELEPILKASQMAQRRLAAGQQGDALQFQAQLPTLLLDPTLEDQALAMVRQMAGDSLALSDARLKKILKDLRESGTAQFPRTVVARNRPCVRALGWNEDLWLPPEVSDLQKARQVFTREWLSEADIAERAKAYSWPEAWVDKVLRTQRGATTELAMGIARRQAGTWNALGIPDNAEQYEIVTAYERLLDADDVPGIYVTAFAPGLTYQTREAQGPDSVLLNYAHGKYPFAVFQLETRSRMTDDARGYGERASTLQQQIKRQWDARIDRADVATLPPSFHPPGEEPDAWGPGVKIPTMQPDRFGYFQQPPPDIGSKEVEETVRRFADEYFGRPVDEQNTVQSQLVQRELVRKWLAGWKEVQTQILQLCQQFMPDQIYFRVIGSDQGKGIRATREEIQGQFGIVLKFNPLDLDQEMVTQKVNLLNQVLQMDANAIIDRNESIVAIMELVDPDYAERLVRPAEAAALREMDDEQTVLAKMLLGIAVDVKGNEAFALRKKTLGETIQMSPIAKGLIQAIPEVRANVERRFDQLNFNIQQKLVNPDIGRRLGTQPSQATNPAAQMVSRTPGQ